MLHFDFSAWAVRLLAAGFAVALLAAVIHRQHALGAEDKKPAPDLASVAADAAMLKDKAVDQAHVMMDVDYHFSNLYFAVQAENWPLAEFFWNETRSHLRWAVRVNPNRKDNAGKEVKLKEILDAVEMSPLSQLKAAIDAKDKPKCDAAYRFMVESCFACHKASDKPYLHPQIPQRPASTMLNFDPKADWPK